MINLILSTDIKTKFFWASNEKNHSFTDNSIYNGLAIRNETACGIKHYNPLKTVSNYCIKKYTTIGILVGVLS